MTATERPALYSPQLLALAVELADVPLRREASLTGEARSRTCGSTIALSCATDDAGAIADIGMKVSACAVGQAAAAIFAQGAPGKDEADIRQAADAIAGWLSVGGAAPDWPRIAMLDAARAHRGRHEAILLPWRAALDALSNVRSAR